MCYVHCVLVFWNIIYWIEKNKKKYFQFSITCHNWHRVIWINCNSKREGKSIDRCREIEEWMQCNKYVQYLINKMRIEKALMCYLTEVQLIQSFSWTEVMSNFWYSNFSFYQHNKQHWWCEKNRVSNNTTNNKIKRIFVNECSSFIASRYNKWIKCEYARVA